MSGFDSLFGVAKFILSSNGEKLNTINRKISECGQVNPIALFKDHLERILLFPEPFNLSVIL